MKRVFDNWNKDCKRHRCAKCKRVRAQSQMRASRKRTNNKRDAKWYCLDCNSRKIKKPVQQWEPEKFIEGRDINYPHKQMKIPLT
jgi:hypothetical protein